MLALHSGDGKSDRAFAGVGWQRDADSLEDAADLAGDGGAGSDALAVLVDGGLLQAVEIAQQVGPFDGEARQRSASSFCSISARNEQKTWPRMAASEE